MPCSSDREWLEARIAKTKEMIEATEEAILALESGAQSYHLDTGQTRQIVTKAQLSQLRNALNALDNRLATLQARLCGGHVHGVPGF
jgi:hypothetical protein